MNSYTSTHEGTNNYVIHEPSLSNEVPTSSEEILEMDDSLTTEMSDILSCITSMKTQLVDLAKRVKSYEKASMRRMKMMVKELNKKKARGAKQPSGFARPVEISHELCDFMNCPYGTQLARTSVTKFIISYIKEHGLENKLNKQEIVLDERLSALLNLAEGTEIKYFSIQKYMNHHFSKMNNTILETMSSSQSETVSASDTL